MIPYGKQSIDEADVSAVAEVLKSDWLTCGPAVERFERALAEYGGAKHAIAVANGTAALHVAALAARLGPGQRLITSPITFLASANCAEFVGAAADFADIDPATQCVSAETLRRAWRDDVKAVVAVDFAGYPCASREMAELVHSKGALLIEDGCHAIGGGRDGCKVGGLPWVDLTVFSFHPVKTITTGEGGAILTNDDDLAARCRRFRNHGMVRDPSLFHPSIVIPPPSDRGPWYYEMPELGYNYRITDLQCALGLSQLKKLDRFVARRQQIVDAYNAAFGALDSVLRPPSSSFNLPPSAFSPAWHLYVLQFDFPRMGKSRTEIVQALKERGVGTQVHYIPVHLQPYYRERRGYGPGKCPAAEAYYAKSLSLPLYPAMTDAEVERVISAVREVTS
jgi:UDP-4-amino-4,6-dideoxy-N-acetyl-beta-L-altrosamine transaminase